MPLPDIDFKTIREHGGCRAKGFEELCCQLAQLQDRPAGAHHYRKGPGADAGVECFTRFADGSERGWQVKYYWQIDSSLMGSLSNSIDVALEKHPNLASYIVCLPFDPSDGRTGKGKTPLAKWEEWRDRWVSQAQIQGRSLGIDLWSASVLIGQLLADGPLHAGRLFYWFSHQPLTQDWLRQRFAVTKHDLGSRYTADTSIALPIRQALLAFARDPRLHCDLEQRWLAISRARSQAIQDIRRLAQGVGAVPPMGFDAKLMQIAINSEAMQTPAAEAVPIQDWLAVLRNGRSLVQSLFEWCAEQSATSEESGRQTRDSAQRALGKLEDALDDACSELQDDRWALVNHHCVLVTGAGGVGKSHLLADVAAYQIEHGRPAVMLLGQKLVEGNPWHQVIAELELPHGTSTDQFLGAMDAAAQAAGVRGLVLIDALNERHGIDIWPDRLAGFMQQFERFPNLGLILSCRSTYVRHVIPASVGADTLPRLEHGGFGTADTRAYLAMRGFALPGVPLPAPELENPLFLKTCCDSLEKKGLRELPKGLQGTTAIFDFYLGAVAEGVETRLRLEPRRRIVKCAVDALARAMATEATEYLLVGDVQRLLDKVLPAHGQYERDLLFQLEAEGLLTIETLGAGDKDPQESVRFTFQRISDHAIASELIETQWDTVRPRSVFAEGGALHRFVSAPLLWEMAGVLEAFAVQLPERFDRELPDLVSEENRSEIAEYFRSSLLWRAQSHFSLRTLELIRELLGEDEIFPTLLRIATEPDNRFNADYLHNDLIAMAMPLRDSKWSIPLAKEADDEDSPVWTLIDWAWQCGFDPIEDRRAELTGITLTWFLTTSERSVRDRATKALAAVLARRAWLIDYLLTRFRGVNDLYLSERLFSSIYGAMMQGFMSEGDIGRVSTLVYKELFAIGSPPLSCLIRDHGRGIIEYVSWRGRVSAPIDMAKARPPYYSPWPLEQVSDDVIDGYQQTRGAHRYRDDIVNSAVTDGDFARYVIDSHVHHWSPAPIGSVQLPTPRAIAQQWHRDFAVSASPDALEAYRVLREKAELVGNQPVWSKTPERAAFEKAEQTFRNALGSASWEDYRIRAQRWLSSATTEFGREDTALFDSSLARRWVCKRAHDLGWSDELHGAFDSGRLISRDRMTHKVERIGKKYQWLALYELGARLVDNCAFIESRWNEDGVGRYDGECLGGLRDLDPSLLVRATQDSGWKRSAVAAWWTPVLPKLKPGAPLECLKWLYDDGDLINDKSCLDVRDCGGGRWLVLHSFGRVDERSLAGHGFELDTWARLSSLVVRKSDLQRVIAALRYRDLRNPHAIPTIPIYAGSSYLGEYPWHPAFAYISDWIEVDSAPGGAPVEIRPTVAEYMCERGTFDYSIDETIELRLPAPWLMTSLDLHLSDGLQVTYVDRGGAVRFFDPALTQEGRHSAVVDRAAFLCALDTMDLAAVWVIAAEKGVYGHGESTGFGGRRVFTSLYWLERDEWQRCDHEIFEAPGRAQLEALLGSDIPSWVRTA